MRHVFVADDDEETTRLMGNALRAAGYRVTAAQDGHRALRCLREYSYDLVLLDVVLKGVDGLEICRRVRGQVQCPIIFLTARTQVEDTLEGFAVGADDYWKKPLAADELVARVEAYLRRASRLEKRKETLSLGGITLDIGARRALRDGKEVALSGREFELLTVLMQNAGRPVSRQVLFRQIWKTEYGDISTVAFNIKNLRAKIDPEGRLIRTVWGHGYQFSVKETPKQAEKTPQ